MAARKRRSDAGASPSAGAAASGAAAIRPAAAGAGAGLLLLAAGAGLLVMTGDPGAGAPRVRIRLPPAGEAWLGLGQTGPQQTVSLPSGAPSGPRQALPQAPLAGLVQTGPGGPLPIIAQDGRRPSDAYARPFQDTGAPKVALVIEGLGLNARETRAAIEQLPPAVTLAFNPYADGLQGWIDLARANGHEVLLQAPMEPADYPQNDPGPYTLMSSDPPPETVRRLEWVLSRGSGYFGVMNELGGRFLTSDSGMTAFSEALRKRGLAFIDDGAASGRAVGVPRASAERTIDGTLDGTAVDQELAALEQSAQQHGAALGVGSDYPLTIQKVQAWAADLSRRGLVLAPASAMTRRP
jgi:polysaccharide deacetylase 2 family uncharacterized protein YibQ